MSKFIINSGDYIDSREFTREECELFCELAVKVGFGFGSDFERKTSKDWWALGVSSMDGGVFAFAPVSHHFKNNITTQFREFLDKEKGMSKFTKDDLKDGMCCIDRQGDQWYVMNDSLVTTDFDGSCLSEWDWNLLELDNSDFDIMRVVDRDGTVLFEREPEVKEMTVADIERELGYSVKVVK